jgi:hypothetical protein
MNGVRKDTVKDADSLDQKTELLHSKNCILFLYKSEVKFIQKKKQHIYFSSKILPSQY